MVLKLNFNPVKKISVMNNWVSTPYNLILFHNFYLLLFRMNYLLAVNTTELALLFSFFILIDIELQKFSKIFRLATFILKIFL